MEQLTLEIPQNDPQFNPLQNDLQQGMLIKQHREVPETNMHTINNINDGRGNFQFFTILKDSDDTFGLSPRTPSVSSGSSGLGPSGPSARSPFSSLYRTSFTTVQPFFTPSGTLTIHDVTF